MSPKSSPSPLPVFVYPPRLCCLLLAVLLLGLTACTPRVEVAAPEPITINMNIKIDHEVRVKVEKDLEEEVFSKDSNLF